MGRLSYNAIERIKKIASMSESEAKEYLRSEKRVEPEVARAGSAAWSGSDATWKTLALRLAEEAQTCLDNSHWEVKFGSGDMLTTIKAIRAKSESESKEHLNDALCESARDKTKP